MNEWILRKEEEKIGEREEINFHFHLPKAINKDRHLPNGEYRIIWLDLVVIKLFLKLPFFEKFPTTKVPKFQNFEVFNAESYLNLKLDSHQDLIGIFLFHLILSWFGS
jgi:hypothetical protein